MAIVCPTCRSVYVDGTLFCDQCGNWLIGVSSQPDEAVPGGSASVEDESKTLPANGSTPRNPVFPEDDEMTWMNPAGGGGKDEREAPGTLPLPRRSDVESGKLPSISGVPTRLRVLVLNTGLLTEWIEDAVVQVGRTDRSVNVFPQIDLEVDGGHNAGVSRRHVRILRQEDGYMVEDLGSINGTFLNRRRLSPGSTSELRDGDELRIGNVVLRVQLGGFSPNS